MIVTTAAIEGASRVLDDFVAHKESLGFTTLVATEENWDGGRGDVAAENLRNKLVRNYEAMGIDHVLLVHKAITEPVYSELTETFMFFTDKDQATAILGDHISKLVKVAVFPEWNSFMVQQGRQERLVQRCTCYGGAQVWAVTLDVFRWAQVIQNGLAENTISLP